MDDLDFDTGVTPDAAALPSPEPQEPQAEPVAEPVAEPEPQPEPVAEPAKAPENPAVPLTALLDEREKRREAERELARFRAAQEQPQAPDPLSDPEGAQAYQANQLQTAILDTKLNLSESAAKRYYGQERVDAAKEWTLKQFAERPGFRQEVLNQPDPYDYAVQVFEREQIASAVTPDDFKTFQAWKAAQAELAQTPPAAPAAPATPAPPKSIASQPNSGGVAHVPLDEESTFNALFE
jgi:hypothetical protein